MFRMASSYKEIWLRLSKGIEWDQLFAHRKAAQFRRVVPRESSSQSAVVFRAEVHHGFIARECIDCARFGRRQRGDCVSRYKGLIERLTVGERMKHTCEEGVARAGRVDRVNLVARVVRVGRSP